MVSLPSPAVVIECPHCGTRYQLPPEALGPKGRKVACAHCGETWDARPIAPSAPPRTFTAPNDVLFDEAAEAALDAEFAAAEQAATPVPAAPAGGAEVIPMTAPPPPADPDEAAKQRTIADIKAAIAPKPKEPTPAPAPGRSDPNQKRRQKDFMRRQAALSRTLPLARFRRVARVGLVSLLFALLVGGIGFRTELVKRFPSLAGVYEAVGLGVNVVGLEFRDVRTHVTMRAGSTMMQVDARIYSVAAQPVAVPPVVITLIDAEGVPLYEWSVTPATTQLKPGEVVNFSTELAAPPKAATGVRLTFNDGSGPGEAPIITTVRPNH